nr:helix-turn-helix domain-containing protein [Candidatus Njordarchaeum guaymaensis]
MEPNSTVEKLKAFGLMENEAKVYLSLVLRGPLGPSEIAAVSRVARAEVHRHLRSLQNRGFCLMVAGKTKRYSAIPADTVLTSIVEQEEIKADLMTKRKNEILSRWINSQTHGMLAGTESEKLQVLKDTEIALERGTKMVMDAKTVARALIHGQTVRTYVSSTALESIENLKILETRKGEKQAEIRILAVSPLEETKNLRDIMRNFEFPLELNIRWATSPVLESLPDTIIKDEDEVLIRITPARGQEQGVNRRDIKAIWTNVQSLINPFTTLFDENWNKAIRFDAERASRGSVLRGDRIKEEISSAE